MIVWHWIYCCIDSGRRIEWILAQYLKYMNRASADLAQFWHSHWPLLEISKFALIIVCFMWFLKSILYFIKFRSVVPFFRLAKCTHKHMHWSNRIEKEIAWRNGDGEIRSEKERNYIAVLSFNGSDGTFMVKQRLYRYRSRAPHSLSCSCWLFFFEFMMRLHAKFYALPATAGFIVCAIPTFRCTLFARDPTAIYDSRIV